jgi:hypothetical protein
MSREAAGSQPLPWPQTRQIPAHFARCGPRRMRIWTSCAVSHCPGSNPRRAKQSPSFEACATRPGAATSKSLALNAIASSSRGRCLAGSIAVPRDSITRNKISIEQHHIPKRHKPSATPGIRMDPAPNPNPNTPTNDAHLVVDKFACMAMKTEPHRPDPESLLPRPRNHQAAIASSDPRRLHIQSLTERASTRRVSLD